MKGKFEVKYHQKFSKYPDSIILATERSVQEGFEYLFESYGNKDTNSKKRNYPVSTMIKMSKGHLGGLFRKIRTIFKYRKDLFRGRNECFTDLDPYYQELESKGSISNNLGIVQSTTNPKLWDELNKYIQSKWDDVIIGFTELPEDLIFKGKFVLFRYAIIVVQEMKKDKIDEAPKDPAGDETMRVYASLGLLVNDIARWLRSKGVKCQSNAPLGGLVCTPPLAGKAGLGWQGRHGNLITPQFGARQRLAPIFLQDAIFQVTDNEEHRWIEEYCQKCGLCQKNCPTQAIFSEKKINIDNIPGIGAMRTCIDREKCFPYFNATIGCSVCIKVCPFSKAKGIYEKLKQNTVKN